MTKVTKAVRAQLDAQAEALLADQDLERAEAAVLYAAEAHADALDGYSSAAVEDADRELLARVYALRDARARKVDADHKARRLQMGGA